MPATPGKRCAAVHFLATSQTLCAAVGLMRVIYRRERPCAAHPRRPRRRVTRSPEERNGRFDEDPSDREGAPIWFESRWGALRVITPAVTFGFEPGGTHGFVSGDPSDATRHDRGEGLTG
jgi:hypothetical protein